jgi:cytoskeletal protein CcmA (bactofilin family)
MFSKGSSSKNSTEKRSNEGRVEPVRSLKPAKSPSSSPSSVAPSIISANLRVTGDLDSDGDIQIDGYVEGDVRSTSVTVGEHAVVSGGLTADIVNVSGTVKGQIHGKVVHLTSAAKVTGDIVHESLAIEAGAFIQGLCRHVDTLGGSDKESGSNGVGEGGKGGKGGSSKGDNSSAIEAKPGAGNGHDAAPPPQAAKDDESGKKLFG